jgi:hypothetical protein
MLQDSPGVDYMPHHISGRAPPRAVCTQFDLDQCGNGSSEPNLLPTAMEDEMVDANARHDRQLRLHGRQMWCEAGSPKGREDEYIELARELQAFKDHPKAGLLPTLW